MAGRVTPVDQEGQPVEGRVIASTSSVFISAVDPGGLPGFADGVETSWNLLQRLGGLIVLIAGWLVPFLWLLIPAWLIWRWRRGRKEAAPAEAVVMAPEPSETSPLEDAEAAEPADEGGGEEE